MIRLVPLTSKQEQSTTDIWDAICFCVKKVVTDTGIDTSTIHGLGFDATCSLAVFSHDTDEPIPVTGPDFSNASGEDRNVILWLDHRPLAEAEKINATGHNLLRYVGGKMSVEMEIPKILWLKNNMPKDLFDRCKFYDLADALTHLATGGNTRSFCSTVCKQGFVPVGVDGSVKGWQEDFYHTIGLGDLVEDDFKRMGGVNGVVSPFVLLFMTSIIFFFSFFFFIFSPCHDANQPNTSIERRVSQCRRTSRWIKRQSRHRAWSASRDCRG